MKKIYLILLSMALLFSLAACGGNESSSSEASTSSPEASSQSVAESSDQPWLSKKFLILRNLRSRKTCPDPGSLEHPLMRAAC